LLSSSKAVVSSANTDLGNIAPGHLSQTQSVSPHQRIQDDSNIDHRVSLSQSHALNGRSAVPPATQTPPTIGSWESACAKGLWIDPHFLSVCVKWMDSDSILFFLVVHISLPHFMCVSCVRLSSGRFLHICKRFAIPSSSDMMNSLLILYAGWLRFGCNGGGLNLFILSVCHVTCVNVLACELVLWDGVIHVSGHAVFGNIVVFRFGFSKATVAIRVSQ
jgi:hypothetical protein